MKIAISIILFINSILVVLLAIIFSLGVESGGGLLLGIPLFLVGIFLIILGIAVLKQKQWTIVTVLIIAVVFVLASIFLGILYGFFSPIPMLMLISSVVLLYMAIKHKKELPTEIGSEQSKGGI